MQITELTAPFGAEVRGWVPARPLTRAELTELEAALAAHTLLRVRGHPRPTHDELVRFARCFGELASARELYNLPFENDDVLEVSNELNADGYERGAAGTGALPWHTDYSFMERPAKETFLEAYVLPPDGGPNTIFCNMYAAYEALPGDLRARLDALVARHTLWVAGNYFASAVDPAEQEARARQTNPDLRYPDDGSGAAHPAVMRHPETGRAALYVSTFVKRFDGMSGSESRALVHELLAHAARPERVYIHDWQPGDLVIFDTVGTIHRRDTVHASQRRTMRQLSTLLPALSA